MPVTGLEEWDGVKKRERGVVSGLAHNRPFAASSDGGSIL